MEIPGLLLTQLLLLTAVISPILVKLISAGTRELRNGKKVQLLLDNPETGDIKRVWAPLKKGEDGDDDEAVYKGRRFILQGDARRTFDGRPAWQITIPHGWNVSSTRTKNALGLGNALATSLVFWRSPRAAETVDANIKMAVLGISNPESYHRRLTRKAQWGDALRANEDRPDNSWMGIAIIVVGVLLLVVLGILAWMANKLGHLPTIGGS